MILKLADKVDIDKVLIECETFPDQVIYFPYDPLIPENAYFQPCYQHDSFSSY